MRVPKTGNPDSTINLAEEIESGFDELGKLSSRLERYAVAKQRALINLSQISNEIQNFQAVPDVIDLRVDRLSRLATRLSRCGNYLSFRDYYTIGVVKLHAAEFCMCHLLCPLCAIRRGSKMVDAYVKRFNTIKLDHPYIKMSMLTLTIKNGTDLPERFDHLTSSLRRLLKHRRKALEGKSNTEFSKVLGLFGTYELTEKGKGWHPHAHLIILHYDRIDVAKLKAEWLKITGDSKVLRIDPSRHPNDPGQDFLEVCKYALKFSDLTPEQNFHAYDVLRGKRLVFSAGLFWGVEVSDDLTDEQPVDWINLPYFDYLYQYVSGSGYNFAKHTDSADVQASHDSNLTPYQRFILSQNHKNLKAR